MASRKKDPERLRKLMTYILERRPDEFGLVLDNQGFVPVKDLLKALAEEPGWGYVRRSHVNEVFMIARGKPFLLEGKKIAAVSHLPQLSAGEETAPPKLLYHCVRRRAYPIVCRQGIGPTKERRVLLATSEALATRMGKRQDPVPVLLTVLAEKAFEAGTKFFRHGEFIYATDHVPVDCFVGPPLPSEKKKEAPKRDRDSVGSTQPLAGSVIFDPGRSEALFKQPGKGKGAKKEVGWKRDVRKLRRQRRRNAAKRGKT